MSVATAIARGDLSRKITVDVKGEILELKNTINTMVDRLNAFAGPHAVSERNQILHVLRRNDQKRAPTERLLRVPAKEPLSCRVPREYRSIARLAQYGIVAR